MLNPPEETGGAEAEELGPPEADISEPSAGDVYNPARDREKTRGALALRVFWLMAVVVTALMASVLSGFRTWDEIQGLAASVLPGVLSVVGTVLGFYFGSEKRGDR